MPAAPGRHRVVPDAGPGPPLDLLVNEASKLRRDYPQVRHLSHYPFSGIAQPITALAPLAVGVPTPLATTPDQPPAVERVVEDADVLGGVAPYRRLVPLAATGAGNHLGVELGGYDVGGLAGGEVASNPLDHGRGLRVGLEQTPDWLAVTVETLDAPISVDPAAGQPTPHDRRLHAAERLLLEVAEEERSDHARDGELDLVDLPLRRGPQPDVIETQLLPDPGHVLAVPRDAVQRLADDSVDLAIAHEAKQPVEAGTIPAVARHLRIGEYRDDRAAQPLHERSAGPNLIV